MLVALAKPRRVLLGFVVVRRRRNRIHAAGRASRSAVLRAMIAVKSFSNIPNFCSCMLR
jgi:hypothetical protein